MNEAGFWDRPETARKTIDAFKTLKAQVDPLEAVMSEFDDARTALELAKESGDGDLLVEADESLYRLQGAMEKVEMQSLLSGPHDHRNCFVTIQAGDGGTEADDWAAMLERMYLYFWEHRGFKVEEVHRVEALASLDSFLTFGWGKLRGPVWELLEKHPDMVDGDDIYCASCDDTEFCRAILRSQEAYIPVTLDLADVEGLTWG